MAAADMVAELPSLPQYIGWMHKLDMINCFLLSIRALLAGTDVPDQSDGTTIGLPKLPRKSPACQDDRWKSFSRFTTRQLVRNSSVQTPPLQIRSVAMSGLVAMALCGCVGPPNRIDTAAQQRAASDPAALIRIADTAAQAGDVQTADAFYKRAVALDPGKVDSRIKYAQVLIAQGHTEDAIEQLTQARAASPENPRLAAALGKLLVLVHRAAPAISVFRSALNTHPSDLPLLVGLGVALDANQNPAAAQDVYRRVIAIEPYSTAARNDLALSLTLSGHPAEALEQFRILRTEMSEAGTSQSALATVSGNLALTYSIQGDMRSAAQAVATSLTPADLAANMRFYSALAPAAPPAGAEAGSELPAAPAVSPASPPVPDAPPA